MKQIIIIITFFSVTQLFAQNTGINTTNPEYTLDVRSLSIEAAGQLNISNLDKSRYVRLFSGSDTYPDPSTTWKPGYNFLFATYDDVTFDFTEYMRIDSIGDVGIGIFNPEAKLDIKGGDWNLDAGNPGDLRIGDTISNLRIGVATGGGGAGTSRIYSSNDLRLGVDNEPIMSMTADGNVGVNNTNPQSKFDIKNIGDGAELLRFTTDRPWVFKQTNSGFLSNLTLQSTIGDKVFEIVSPDSSKVSAAFLASDNSPRVFLIPDDGRLGVGTNTPNARMAVEGDPSESENIIRVNVNYEGNTDLVGVDCDSYPATGYGVGANFRGGYRGVRGICDSGNSTRQSIGVVGAAFGTNNQGTRVGLWGNAYGGETNWAGYFDSGNVYVRNELRIGSGAVAGAAGYKVAIDGKVIAEEVRVQLSGDWPDYVFEEDYELISLDQLEEDIKTIGHLPGVPSAQKVEEDGILLGDMHKILLKKIEELTLYTIGLKKEINELKSQIEN